MGHKFENNVKVTVPNNNHDVSFLDAESLDSGMSLTNALDARHTEPEYKVFYKTCKDIV